MGKKFERGDRILVQDDHTAVGGFKRIFLAFVQGAECPYITVHELDEDEFYAGEEFRIIAWQYAEPIAEEEHIIDYAMFAEGKLGVRCPICNKHIQSIAEAMVDEHFYAYIRKDGKKDFQHFRDEEGNMCISVILSGKTEE
jgi:hypothetical protein